MTGSISLGQYLFKRIAELGIEHVFGVPGDFNLWLLDELFKLEGPRWLGACNELNAAYAADGYARIKGVPGVLVTTYAVGELSAMNGVAGSYAEHAGMIHIVGMPTRQVQKARPLIHHTLEPGMDQALYVGMAAPIRKTYTVLYDDATMAQEVDRVIEAGVKSRLPVYIYLPLDVANVMVDSNRLATPLDVQVKNADSAAEDEVVRRTLNLIKTSTKPALLADVLATRHGGRELTRELLELTRFPAYSTVLSKGIIDETHPCYNGLYNGEVSFDGIAQALESSDVVLNIGPLMSDSNTGGYSRNIADNQVVLLGHDFCQIQEKRFDGVHFLPVLRRIVKELRNDMSLYKLPRDQFWTKIEHTVLSKSTSGPIIQDYLWQRIGSFVRPNDIVLAESGTAQFGMPDALFPENVGYITQIFWSSIGYTVGAALGACVAAKELKRPGRVVLIVGEGSLQMTVQEIGTMIRFGYTPVIFVINNGGYTIERAINGEQQSYNDVSLLWDHTKMLEMFGAREQTGIKGRSMACRTVEELEAVLNDGEFGKADCIQVCEIFMDPLDYPWRLKGQLKIARAKAKQAAKLAA